MSKVFTQEEKNEMFDTVLAGGIRFAAWSDWRLATSITGRLRCFPIIHFGTREAEYSWHAVARAIHRASPSGIFVNQPA